MVVEELLQLFVGEVDAKLLESIKLLGGRYNRSCRDISDIEFGGEGIGQYFGQGNRMIQVAIWVQFIKEWAERPRNGQLIG